jgi:glycosyltransferase involved in cell wall biosynthesis
VVTLPARMTRWKGQLPFLDLVAGLRAEGVPVHGLLVGGHDVRRQPYVDEVRAEIGRRGLAGEVSVLGHRDDLREIIAVSDAVVSLSIDPEAFGRVTLEALGMGRPVAAFAHGGVAEQLAALLPEGIVTPGDVGAMIERLVRWHAVPPTVPDANPFTLQRMLDATLEVYREAVAEHR